MAWLEYVLPLIFLFPMAAMASIVLALRSLHDARVHSPFNAPLHEPGQALRQRLDKAFSSLFLNGALGPIISLAPLVYGMGRMLFVERQDWVEWALYGLLSTLLVLAFSLLLVRDYQRIRRLKLGLACELAVGQELERLVRPDAHPYYVFHDVPTDSFTIDHVVVTPMAYSWSRHGQEHSPLVPMAMSSTQWRWSANGCAFRTGKSADRCIKHVKELAG
ncbi:hypothetical protein HORIV_05240 [Vreelandella olivaria]|uniref:NERD domain-containing protein n=1 Tax=Vreelandella olivaria TaxID=390919 RepID=A0ABM7GCH8_9GAMM|nr:hypothetical protein HORIV_05240 [Halomonas olivaria]